MLQTQDTFWDLVDNTFTQMLDFMRNMQNCIVASVL